MKRKLKSKVTNVLTRSKTSRDNDNLLIAKVLKDTYGTSDMEEIAQITNISITESITRLRRIIQRTNPLLAPSHKTTKRRKQAEKQWHEEMVKEI